MALSDADVQKQVRRWDGPPGCGAARADGWTPARGRRGLVRPEAGGPGVPVVCPRAGLWLIRA